MALFTKDDKSATPEPKKMPASQPTPAPTRRLEVNAHLGQGARVEGKLTFKGSVQIDGEVEGEIHADDTVTLGESARVNARISAATIVAQGHVEGDLVASKRIELRAPASILGNVTTPTLIIQEGVRFEGRSDMGGKTSAADSGDKVAIFPTDERGASRRKNEASK